MVITERCCRFTDICERRNATLFRVEYCRMGQYLRPNRQLSFYYYTASCPLLNHLRPNDPYRGRTAPLTSKSCILYIYSTNIGTEYFKHGIYPLFFSFSKCSLFHNSNIFGSCIIHILYTGCAVIKK